MSPRDHAREILAAAGIEATPHRLLVLSLLCRENRPLSAPELLRELAAESSLNKVTLYRILDLLEERGILLKHSAPDRSFRYCLGRKAMRGGHCHFFCTSCGQSQCLEVEGLMPDTRAISHKLHQDVDNVEIRLDGICERCRRQG